MFVWFLTPCYVFAGVSDIERIAPKQVSEGEPGQLIQDEKEAEHFHEPNRDAVIVDELKGLVLIAHPDQLASEGRQNLNGIVIEGLNIPDEAIFREQLQSFLHQPVTLNLLDVINRKVVNYFRDYDWLVVDAFAPAGQDIANGVIQIVVLPGKQGEVNVEGSRYFSEKSLSRQVRTKSGEALSRSLLEEDIALLNNNLFRTV